MHFWHMPLSAVLDLTLHQFYYLEEQVDYIQQMLSPKKSGQSKTPITM